MVIDAFTSIYERKEQDAVVAEIQQTFQEAVGMASPRWKKYRQDIGRNLQRIEDNREPA